MESLLLCFLLALFLSVTTVFVLFSSSNKSKLPPGPPALPFVGNLFWLRRSFRFHHFEPLLRQYRARYGPIITLRIGSVPAIFISDRLLAHKALVEHGASFSDRPIPLPAARFLSSNQHVISAAAYGPFWRVLRRSLISDVLHPSRVRIYADGRRWVFDILSRDLRARSKSGDGVVDPKGSFQFAMFCLLVLMCFGEKLDEKSIREIETAQRNYLLHVGRLNSLVFFPEILSFFLRKSLKKARELRRRQKEVFDPLIRTRMEQRKYEKQGRERFVCSYIDTLLDIEPPENGGKKLSEDDVVALCSEFLNAGTDTTSTALQWIIAELVKNQGIQTKLAEEVDGVLGDREIREEDLQKMPYLKAVVMEGLRRHPPGHFVLPHSVSEDVKFEGYLIPKKAVINFTVADMAWDEKVWEEPIEFRPERFMTGGEGFGVDITGSREIKMMPFGAGRRICPGLGLAVLHLEYFVANLVREFEWRMVEGDEVDLSEKMEFTVVMKNPLRTRLVPRSKAVD
ncbi:Cytochrome P450 89A9 [Apostasia shenzhenica]|uniref:Cytochrome P450 89A9 n=1 Tax=Apostasia shenzhenica TaxID=1088818 RepID=A0A2I0A3U4_9ASPA|nr:Cytochrome P450 89A9 [Apostasia shenzhenica]